MTSDRTPRARAGQWYTREVDDPIDGVQDQSAAPVGATDLLQVMRSAEASGLSVVGVVLPAGVDTTSRSGEGRWYTRDDSDPIDSIFDTSPAVFGTSDGTWLVDPGPEG